MKASRVVLLLVVLAVGFAAWAASQILHDGLSAVAKPSRLEVFLARQVRHYAVPSHERELKNPVADSPEVQREGRLHFANHCANCHANDGSGDSMYGNGMYPKPPDMRTSVTQNLTDGELVWVIENGVRFTGMPGFGGGEKEPSEIGWKLVRFIRHLPQLTPAEKMEMEKYNPKGPEDRAEDSMEQNFLNGGEAKPAENDAHAHHH